MSRASLRVGQAWELTSIAGACVIVIILDTTYRGLLAVTCLVLSSTSDTIAPGSMDMFTASWFDERSSRLLNEANA